MMANFHFMVLSDSSFKLCRSRSSFCLFIFLVCFFILVGGCIRHPSFYSITITFHSMFCFHALRIMHHSSWGKSRGFTFICVFVFLILYFCFRFFVFPSIL